jgi:hypothetical protein
MSLPGFHSELSLYRSTASYQLDADSSQAPGHGRFDDSIVPALCNPTAFQKCINASPSGPGALLCNLDYGDCLPNSDCCEVAGQGLRCENLDSNSACGGCGRQCAAGTICCDRVCCATNSCCDGTCVDLDTDGNNCGKCQHACGAGDCCVKGVCVSSKGSDPRNCGACGHHCQRGQVCCNGTCVNLNTNTHNCGKCGAVCTSGSCCNGNCVDTSTNTLNCGKCGNSCGAGQICQGGCCVNNIGALAGFTNYQMANSCSNITSLNVGFIVTETLTANQSFSLQLNAFNPPTFQFNPPGALGSNEPTTWMQFVIIFNGTSVQASIQYWDVPGYQACFRQTGNPSQCLQFQTVNSAQPTFASLPANNTLPAGYSCSIQVLFDSAGNAVSGYFTLVDNHSHASVTQLSVDANHQIPLQAFQANLVGNNNNSVTFSSGGAGYFEYLSAPQICVEGGLPETCTSGPNSTAEGSNASYATMSACCGSALKQQVTIP